jgi:hypothetical protein
MKKMFEPELIKLVDIEGNELTFSQFEYKMARIVNERSESLIKQQQTERDSFNNVIDKLKGDNRKLSQRVCKLLDENSELLMTIKNLSREEDEENV